MGQLFDYHVESFSRKVLRSKEKKSFHSRRENAILPQAFRPGSQCQNWRPYLENPDTVTHLIPYMTYFYLTSLDATCLNNTFSQLILPIYHYVTEDKHSSWKPRLILYQFRSISPCSGYHIFVQRGVEKSCLERINLIYISALRLFNENRPKPVNLHL